MLGFIMDIQLSATDLHCRSHSSLSRALVLALEFFLFLVLIEPLDKLFCFFRDALIEVKFSAKFIDKEKCLEESPFQRCLLNSRRIHAIYKSTKVLNGIIYAHNAALQVSLSLLRECRSAD